MKFTKKTKNIQHTEVVKESKSLNSISTEGGFLTFYLDQAFRRICGRATCGKMNGCFGTNALYTSEDNVNLQLYTDFSRSNHYGTEWKLSSK